MRLRRAVLDDVDAIAGVHVRGWQTGYRGQLPDAVLDALEPVQRVPRWTATLEGSDWPRRGTLVAEQDGVVVGFADLRPTEDRDQPSHVGEIVSFYVDPAAWGRGCGRLLMAGSVRMMAAAGFTAATLWVLDTNTRAARFYARSGWTSDGTLRTDVVGGLTVHDRRLRRPLAVSAAQGE